MSGIPKVGAMFEPAVTAIYLDQCVISRFVPDIDPSWSTLFETLSLGHARGKILCPHSLEHLVESAAMSPDRGAAADELLRTLSLGWSLQVEPQLVAAQLKSVVREVPLTRNDILIRHPFKPLSDQAVHAILATSKANLDSFNESKFRISNAIKALTRIEPRETWATMMEIMATIARRYAADLKSEVGTVLARGQAEIKAEPDAPHMPTWTSYIVYLLVTEHQFTHRELTLLDGCLDASLGLLFLPFFQVKAALEAYRSWNRKKFEASDQYDVTRVACALPFVDILITDGSVANALRETRVDTFFRTEVFSTKDRERTALLQRLTDAIA